MLWGCLGPNLLWSEFMGGTGGGCTVVLPQYLSGVKDGFPPPFRWGWGPSLENFLSIFQPGGP